MRPLACGAEGDIGIRRPLGPCADSHKLNADVQKLVRICLRAQAAPGHRRPPPGQAQLCRSRAGLAAGADPELAPRGVNNGSHRAHSTRAEPSRSAQNRRSNAVLPIPASPATSTIRPCPLEAAAAKSSRRTLRCSDRSSSPARPMPVVSPCRAPRSYGERSKLARPSARARAPGAIRGRAGRRASVQKLTDTISGRPGDCLKGTALDG
jgi:hypothetical protein